MKRLSTMLLLLTAVLLMSTSCSHENTSTNSVASLTDPWAEAPIERLASTDLGHCDATLHAQLEEYLANEQGVVFQSFHQKVNWELGGVIDATPDSWPAGYEIRMIIPPHCVSPDHPGYEEVEFGIAVPAFGPGPGVTSVPYHFYPDGVPFQVSPELILAWPPWAGAPNSETLGLVNIMTEIHDGEVHFRVPDSLVSASAALASGKAEPAEGWSDKDLSTGLDFRMPHFSRWELIDDNSDDGGNEDKVNPIEETGPSCWSEIPSDEPEFEDFVQLNP